MSYHLHRSDGGTWAKGKWAKFICQRCGFDYPYRTRRRELSGLFVCESCYDGANQALNYPGDKPPPFRLDAPLHNPLPDIIMDEPPPLIDETSVVVEVLSDEDGVYLLTEDGLSVIDLQ